MEVMVRIGEGKDVLKYLILIIFEVWTDNCR